MLTTPVIQYSAFSAAKISVSDPLEGAEHLLSTGGKRVILKVRSCTVASVWNVVLLLW